MDNKVKRTRGNSTPICPFCEKEINSIETAPATWNGPAVYLCPNCKKVLSVGGVYG